MEPRYTIGQLAKAAGVPSSTVRYYERVGLVRPSGRSGGNYRLYDAGALERLRFIRAAQATGFTLDDVTGMLGHRHDSTASCREVQGLIENRLRDLERRLEDLRHVERVLRSALDACRETEKPGRCELIDRLSQASSPAPKRSALEIPKKRP
ncbi:MAG TPA: heavy metal-responsive transcriptional regulator [Isosphaeraceae bacterium]|jgi:MerR family mercuric resistance operon transcriptional regulator|nr:heavy metal-responsive transcriptional regulator [Isosphaeraceae bacterium]